MANAERFDAPEKRCWHASILQHLNFTDPRIGAFDGPLHTRTVEEFRTADHAHIDATASRVLRAVAEHITRTRDAYPDESRLVEHQANLKRRHLPIRQLFATYTERPKELTDKLYRDLVLKAITGTWSGVKERARK